MVGCVKNEFCFDCLTNCAKIQGVVTPRWWQRRADWGEHSPGQHFFCRGVEKGCLPGPDPGSGQTRGQTGPVAACEECLQCPSSVVDNDRLFIPGPAVVEILHDNRPIRRCFCFPPGRRRGLFPQPEMAEDAFYDIRVINQADDFHLMAAAGRTETVDFPDFLYEISPYF